MSGTTSPLGFPYPTAGDPMTNIPAQLQQLAEALDDYLAALAAVAPATWATPTYASGWSSLGGESSQYARSAGIVVVTLAAVKATYASGETIFTLPAGFRPTRRIRAVGQFNATIRNWSVLASGAVVTDDNIGGGILGTVPFQV